MSALAIRFAEPDDRDRIMHFWHEHWIAEHIMSRDAELFAWQYQDGDKLNIVIAEKGDELLGFLGYIPDSRFDADAPAEEQVIALAGWRTKDGAPPALGTALLAHLRKNVPHGALGTLGLNADVARLYERMGFKTGLMDHWVLPNWQISAYRLLILPAGIHPPTTSGNKTLLRLSENDFPLYARGRKSGTYISARYAHHPRYEYRIFGVERDGTPEGLIVLRIAEAEGAKALRLIDISGPQTLFAGAAPALQELMHSEGVEYADFFSHGIEADFMKAAGFLDVAATGATVPNHFEPFVPDNRPVPYAILNPQNIPLTLCKGDGDQDRPNIGNTSSRKEPATHEHLT